jgi:hypothetical protein
MGREVISTEDRFRLDSERKPPMKYLMLRPVLDQLSIFLVLLFISRGTALAQRPLGVETYGELSIYVLDPNGRTIPANGDVTLVQGGPYNYPGGSVVDWYEPFSGNTLRGFSWEPGSGHSYGKHIDRWGEEGQTYANSQIGYAKYRVQVNYSGLFEGVYYDFDSYVFVDWRDADYTVSGAYAEEDLFLTFRLSGQFSGSWSYFAQGSSHPITQGQTLQTSLSYMKSTQGCPKVPVTLTSPSGYVWLRQGTSGGQAYSTPCHVRLSNGTLYQMAAYDQGNSLAGPFSNLTPVLTNFGQSYSFPSSLSNVSIGIYSANGFAYPWVTWSESSDGDVTDGGNILVERRVKPSGQGWTAWSTIATLGGTSTEFIDFSILRACQGNCPDQVQYRLAARNSNQLSSVYSSVASITAYGALNPKIYTTTNKSVLATEARSGPRDFEGLMCYPNPANPSTKLNYALRTRAHVRLVVFNNLGQETRRLVDDQQDPGYHSAQLSGEKLATGIYYAVLQVTGDADKKFLYSVARIVILK